MLGGDGGQTDAALMAELEELGQHVLRFNERVRSFVRRVDEELARSSRLLSSAVDRAEEG
jgi:phosphate uptake regulator